MTNRRPTIADDELEDDWSNADILARLNDGGPSNLSMVLRVVAARLASQAHDTTDPMFVLSDAVHTLESLHATARIVLDKYEQLDDERAPEMLDCLASTIGSLHEIAHNF